MLCPAGAFFRTMEPDHYSLSFLVDGFINKRARILQLLVFSRRFYK